MFARRPRPFRHPTLRDRLAADAADALVRARDHAAQLGYAYVGPDHVLAALLENAEGPAVRRLERVGVDVARLRADLVASLSAAAPRRSGRRSGSRDAPLPYTSWVKKLIEASLAESSERGNRRADGRDLLIGLAQLHAGSAADLLRRHGVIPELLRGPSGDDVDERRFGDGAPALDITLDDTSDRTITEQIVTHVQEAVATGRLRAGDRLPAIRQLADSLEIAPGTVARAIQELERLGVVVTDGARGTRIAERPSPKSATAAEAARRDALRTLLRPVVVSAFHLGASAEELRGVLDDAMSDIYTSGDPSTST